MSNKFYRLLLIIFTLKKNNKVNYIAKIMFMSYNISINKDKYINLLALFNKHSSSPKISKTDWHGLY